jgi:hypothetical protein
MMDGVVTRWVTYEACVQEREKKVRKYMFEFCFHSKNVCGNKCDGIDGIW